jgi:hypothetical protein
MHAALRFEPDDILRELGVRVWQQVKEVEVLSEGPPVNDPDEVAVECLSCVTFGIGDARVLNLNVDAGRCSYIGPMHLTVSGDVADLTAVFWKELFPGPVPRRFILPPWIAVSPASMSPVVHDPRAAFGEHLGATSRAYTNGS